MTDSAEDIDSVVARLRAALGDTLTATLASAPDEDAVASWAVGVASPDSEAAVRLRIADEVVSTLLRKTSPAASRDWMARPNPTLGDQQPAEILRDANVTVARRDVLGAANSFVAG